MLGMGQFWDKDGMTQTEEIELKSGGGGGGGGRAIQQC